MIEKTHKKFDSINGQGGRHVGGTVVNLWEQV